MNVALLIDAIVRQTMVLVAQLATTAGMRAPLAHVANQVFLDLVSELQAQGVGQKIIADMFGMALRTYHAKVRRLSESATDRGRSLWEAVLDFLKEKDSMVTRAEVLSRFSRDDSMTVRGVLNDLVETGLVLRMGRGDHTAYRAASVEELGFARGEDPEETASHMAWITIHHHSGATRTDLLSTLAMEEDVLERALARLLADGRITEETQEDGTSTFHADFCVIPYGNPVGWEAAVFDHYQALVMAICTKLDKGRVRSDFKDAIGGSTYGFDLWRDHPMQDEVLNFLSETRQRASELRARVDEFNAAQAKPDDPMRVIFYAGQTVMVDEPEEERE